MDLPSDVVDDGPQLEIVEKLNVIDRVLAQLGALFVTMHVSVRCRGCVLGPA